MILQVIADTEAIEQIEFLAAAYDSSDEPIKVFQAFMMTDRPSTKLLALFTLMMSHDEGIIREGDLDDSRVN